MNTPVGFPSEFARKMANITAANLAQAAERWREQPYSNHVGSTCTTIQRDADAALLASAYVAREKERALPIDEEWLLSLGFAYVPSHMGPEYSDDMQLGRLRIWDFNGECWLMEGSDWFKLKTRGHILDLMRVTGTVNINNNESHKENLCPPP